MTKNIFLYLTTLLTSRIISAGPVPPNFYAIEMENAKGEKIHFSDFKNKVVLIVNVASKCGFTPQYDALEKLHKQYKDKGLVVLGFPTHDFFQEPGSEEEVVKFCKLTYGVDFPIFKKTHVIGKEKNQLFNFLVNNAPEKGEVKWNFEKFIVDKKGNVVGRFRSKTKPDSKEVLDLIDSSLK
jgi:glutathione peroxidase